MTVAARANAYNYLVVFLATWGSFTYGFNVIIIGSVLGLPSFYPYFAIDPTTSKGSSITGAINGLWAGGGAIGCWIVHLAADRYGRRRAIQVICTLNIASAILQGAAVNIEMMLVGRFFNGIGTGAILCITPTFIAEISPPRQRGRLVGIHGFVDVASSSVACWVGYGAYFLKNPHIQWRLCVCLQIVAPLMLLLGSPLLPESPRWLVAQGRDAQAIATLEKLHHKADDPDNTTAHFEFLQIQSQIELERSQKMGIIGMFKKPSYRKRLLVGFFVQSLCQCTGVLVVAFYQVSIYNSVGVTGSLPLLLLAVYNGWAASLNGLNAMIIDRVGRIRIMTIGFIGAIIMMSGYTAMLARFQGTTNKVGNGFAIFFLFGYVGFYGSCLDSSSYTYCSEIFPTAIRAQGVGFSISGLYIMTLIFTQIAPTAYNNVHWKYNLCFICIPAVGLYFLRRYCPETAKLSLEEIAAKFGDEVALESSDQVTSELKALDHHQGGAAIEVENAPKS